MLPLTSHEILLLGGLAGDELICQNQGFIFDTKSMSIREIFGKPDDFNFIAAAGNPYLMERHGPATGLVKSDDGGYLVINF